MEVNFMFQIGDKAVYPGHGVGVIEAIESKHIMDSEQLFYVLRILERDDHHDPKG